jgi:hypothetical protein
LPPTKGSPCPCWSRAWLEEQGLHEEFREFQVDHWRRHCRELRRAVDQYAP